MTQTKTTALLGFLAVGLLPMFASTEAGTDRCFLSLQTPISPTKTADAPQPGKAPLSGDLRWVRGSVLSWASNSLTLQLKRGSLTLELSVSTQIIHAVKGTEKVISAEQLKDEVTGPNNETKPDSLAVGSLVQTHYVEHHHKSYAIVIIEETESAPQSSKKSGSSYLGVLDKTEFGAIHLRVNGGIRWLYPFHGTTFVDSTGHRLPARELKAGDTFLITYRLDAAVGDLTGPTTTALEIRRLTLP